MHSCAAQAGSQIVESLRTYRSPVIVYLPPGAELRGGAWVVIDSQINAAQVHPLSVLGRTHMYLVQTTAQIEPLSRHHSMCTQSNQSVCLR